jgi:hypothetical protein
MFERTIFRFAVKKISLFKNIQTVYENMEAISDDYYDVASVIFIVNEYHRTIEDHQKFMKILNKMNNSPDSVI